VHARVNIDVCRQVYTNAATPYHGLSDDDVLLTLASGAARPVCPLAGVCPDWLQRLVTACTALKPHDRITAAELAVSVGKCLADCTA